MCACCACVRGEGRGGEGGSSGIHGWKTSLCICHRTSGNSHITSHVARAVLFPFLDHRGRMHEEDRVDMGQSTVITRNLSSFACSIVT